MAPPARRVPERTSGSRLRGESSRREWVSVWFWRDVRANFVRGFPFFRDHSPGRRLLPRGGCVSRAVGLWAIGQVLSPLRPQCGRLRGDSIRRLCTCLTHRRKPPPCAMARCLGPILSRLGSRRVSVRPLCAAAPTSRHAIDCPCNLAGRLTPVFAILLGRLDSPGMGNGIRGGGASCWGSPLSRLPLILKLILPGRL